MSLKIKIAARLKAKAAGVNLSQTRIDAIVSRAEKSGLTDESDDTAIDAQLDQINELTPFKEIASFDDHQRAKAKKDADEKEALRLKAIEEGKVPPVEMPNDAPEWMKVFMANQAAQTKVLTDQIAALSGDKVTNARKDALLKALDGLPETFRELKLESFEGKSFKDDAEFDSFIEKTKTQSAGFVQEESNNGLGNDRPAGGKGGNANAVKLASDAELDAVMENL
jgi:hypothetical protein